MAIYSVKLKNRAEVAYQTMAFYFEKPAGFDFKAGQTIDITLINPPQTDDEGNIRTFSIASAPYEKQLMVATRMRDTAFKRVLKTMLFGTEIKIEGPFGSMTLHNNVKRPAVFLTGGIGITPFRSIVLDTANKKLPHKIFLFYSNRRPEDAAFLNEMKKTEDQNKNFKLIATMTESRSESGGEKSKKFWQGEMGYINKEMLARYIDDLTKPIYYIAGPPQMAAAMKLMLNQTGINDDDIKMEEFAGY